MNQTYIIQLNDRIGEEVTLKGWLYKTRSSGNLELVHLLNRTRSSASIIRG